MTPHIFIHHQLDVCSSKRYTNIQKTLESRSRGKVELTSLKYLFSWNRRARAVENCQRYLKKVNCCKEYWIYVYKLTVKIFSKVWKTFCSGWIWIKAREPDSGSIFLLFICESLKVAFFYNLRFRTVIYWWKFHLKLSYTKVHHHPYKHVTSSIFIFCIVKD